MLFISIILNILLLFIIGFFFCHYRLLSKISEKVGWSKPPRTQDYLTTMSWNNTMQSLSYEADVVLFGASITSDGRWQEIFDSVNLCNLGKSGDRLSTMLWRIPQITAVHPKKIFLAMEQNDMHDLSVGEIEKAYNVLLDSIIRSNPQAKIYLESLTPLNECQFKRVCDNKKIKEVNAVIRGVATKRGFQFIDIYSIYEQDGQMPMSISTDGQHLKTEAYERWATVLKPYIEK